MIEKIIRIALGIDEIPTPWLTWLLIISLILSLYKIFNP